MNPILKEIEDIGIVPVIAIDDVEKAVPLANALVAGGIPCAEVTFRTKEGEEAIKRMAQQVPDILVGAGTVLTTDQVDRALAAGAKFLVSPGLNPKIVAYCKEKNMPITPGCANPSDIERALELGLDVVKFFPAEQAGGLSYIKSISAPYSRMKFMPTGGINPTNMVEYLAFDKILACGGSWMVSKKLIQDGNFQEITRLCKEAVSAMLGFQLVQVGVNRDSEQKAKEPPSFLNAFLSVSGKGGRASTSVRPVECLEKPSLWERGQITLSTLQISRAIAYLKRLGVECREDTICSDEQGNIKSIYLKEDVLGFGIHLIAG